MARAAEDRQEAAVASAQALLDAARGREEQGEYAEAEIILERARAVTQMLGRNPKADRLRLETLTSLGQVQRVQGHYEDAEQHCRAALVLAEAEVGAEAVEVAEVANELGVTLKYRGDFEEAERLYRRALAIFERDSGADYPAIATIYHNMGGLEHARGNFDNAEPLARLSVEIRQKAAKPDELELAADRAALAAILDGAGKTAEAEGLPARSALAIFERHLGSEHHEVAVTLNNLAAIAQRGGDVQEAESLYRRALAIKEQTLGPEQPELAPTLNNLALLCVADDRFNEAESLCGRAIELLEANVSPTHPTLLACRENYAALRPSP